MQDGTGMLRLQFDRLKEKLLADGIFDDHNKTPLPNYAQNIAIITSPKGAALQDFISILNRKNWTGKISIFPSSVQGKEAPSELLHSLKLIEKYQHYDLVVLARGGGSIEDLWAFNNERLVRSVADFNMPIISAIGHQTDFVLTDFASDFRAETPSAAAEWICNLHRNQEEHLNDLAKQLTDLPKRKIEQHTEKLNLATMRLRNCSPKSRVEVFHQYLDEFSNRMDTRILHTIDQNKLKVSSLGKRLESNSLKSVLNRGFAFFEGQDGKTLENAKMLKKGETVKAVFKDGKKDLEVKN
jgi:exodeoxyribonuclease VII large subunit